MPIRAELEPALRTGEFVTDSFQVATDSTSPIIVRPVLVTEDMYSPDYSVGMGLYCLDAESQEWVVVGGHSGWQGHPEYDPNDPDQQPGPEWNSVPLRGETVRAQLYVPVSLVIGVQVEAD